MTILRGGNDDYLFIKSSRAQIRAHPWLCFQTKACFWLTARPQTSPLLYIWHLLNKFRENRTQGGWAGLETAQIADWLNRVITGRSWSSLMVLRGVQKYSFMISLILHDSEVGSYNVMMSIRSYLFTESSVASSLMSSSVLHFSVIPTSWLPVHNEFSLHGLECKNDTFFYFHCISFHCSFVFDFPLDFLP